MPQRVLLSLFVVLTAAALWAVGTGLRLSPDVADLLPDTEQGSALRLYAHSFGGGGLAYVLVRGADPDKVREATEAARLALRNCPEIKGVVDRPAQAQHLDPTLAWAFATARGRAAIETALTPQGMSERLSETRRLLLGPGMSAWTSQVQVDPLRLFQIATEASRRGDVAEEFLSTGTAGSPTSLLARDGTARLILLAPSGQALRGGQARQLVQGVQVALTPVRASFPEVRLDLAGGHAIAAATETMIRRDLWLSGTASMLLAAVVFALTFRRLRALVAVLPPLAVGTLWTAALAGTLWQGVSAIAVAFVSVVVGVGVDTGVHVYAALLRARREGLQGQQAADRARRVMAVPTLSAALAAAVAFASTGLSGIPALRQLGLLCAAGEILTAIAILVVTPVVGAWLERSAVPVPAASAWVGWVQRAVLSKVAPVAVGSAAVAAVVVLVTLGLPGSGGSFVALRSEKLEPIRTENAIYETFGGGPGQWVVLVRDSDEERARTRSDAMVEALQSGAEHVTALDALTFWAPSRSTQRARLAERDRLDLPGKVGMLRASLEQGGFDAERFESALEAFRNPSQEPRDVLEGDRNLTAFLRARYLATDDTTSVAALYMMPRHGHETQAESLIRQADGGAMVTGYARLDSALRDTLARDFPRIAAVALALVAVVMAAALRRARDVVLVIATVVFELLWVTAIARCTGIRVHAYNALVIPVLFGVTIDEAMFLLHRMRRGAGTIQEAIAVEASSVTATALTTAAGFAALVVCDFEGLADLGKLGVLGVLVGLVAALVVVPVGARVLGDGGRCRDSIRG